jgi:two-component system, NtrC family, sensor kinase
VRFKSVFLLFVFSLVFQSNGWSQNNDTILIQKKKEKELSKKNVKKTDSIGLNNVHYFFGKNMEKDHHIAINKGWRYINEDNPNVSKNDFVDTTYSIIRINKHLDSFQLGQPRVVWIRKIIKADSVFLTEMAQLSIAVNGAAVVYIDNQKVLEIGDLKKNLEKSDIFTTKTTFYQALMLKDTNTHVLAIKFLLPTKSHINHLQSLPAINADIIFKDNVIPETYMTMYLAGKIKGISGAIYIMMALIHFFFYYLFRTQRFNLHFCIGMILFGIFFLNAPSQEENSSFWSFTMKSYLRDILFHLGHLVLLSTTYEFVDFPKKKLFWSVVVLWIIVVTLKYLGILPSYAMPILGLLIIINYIYIINRSSKQNNMHGFIVQRALAYFAIFFLILMVTIVVLFFVSYYYSMNLHIGEESFLFQIFGLAIIVGPPLMLSGSITFSLAKEYLRAAEGLKFKITEVEKLARENQAILSSQNTLLEEQVAIRTNDLNKSIQDLKNTQKQLIQSEKMASLGELTAGIAHEIKNPLNFVNNFSEINIELLDELSQEISKGNLTEIDELKSQIKENLSKISMHGKRADNIVKSMLEHSRNNSTGVKDSISINRLIEENVNLAFHGIRAKDKSFNTKISLDLDSTISNIKVMPQDIGRVIINLTTNAFHAVNQKLLESKAKGEAYEPTVTVKTSQNDNETTISIKDNGTGIPKEIIEKIFQPFFTTKPTGQGTGLGLSLTYDIIDAHGGSIKVLSEEGQGTEFIITLPC